MLTTSALNTTVMSVKTDKTLKEQAQSLAKKMGFPLGTLINAFLRQFLREKAVYFSMEPTYKMSKALEKELAKVEEDIKTGKNIVSFENMDKAIKYLNEHES